jgi:hypothetical protein
MKLFFILIFLLCSNLIIAQTTTESEILTTDSIPTKKQREEIEKQITQIDYHLNSIEVKIQYIEENPDQKRIAEEEGWFTNMKSTKEALEQKKKDLQKLLSK